MVGKSVSIKFCLFLLSGESCSIVRKDKEQPNSFGCENTNSNQLCWWKVLLKKYGLIDLLGFAAGKFSWTQLTFRVKDINSHDDSVDMVEYEGDPVAARVDASPHELGNNRGDHGQEDEAEHRNAPRIVVVQNQLKTS